MQFKQRYLPGPLTAVCIAVVWLTVASVALGAPDNEKTRNRAERALRSGDFERAEQIYREILAKDDHDTEARLGLSRALLKQRRLQDSFDHAARVIAIDPLSSRAHALLGSAILASGDFRLSVEEFRTALSLNANEAMAVAGMAMIDYYENRMYPCVLGLRRAATIDPDEPDYLFNLGQAAARSERYKEAADAYERFLVVAPRTDADRRARIRGLIDFLRYLGQQGSLYNLEGNNRTVVPFETPDFRPVLKIRVNGGKQLLRFVLDTGSGMSVLSEETAQKLGIKPVARGGLARAVGGGGRFEIVYGYLRSIDIGDVRVTNVPVYIRHFFDEKNPVDGYLGIAAISRLLMMVDYGTNRLTLSRPDSSDLATIAPGADKAVTPDNPDTTGTNVPIRTTASGFLSGEVTLEGLSKPLNFIIDTGATVTVLSEKTAALDEVQRFIKSGKMRVFGAAGVADDVKTASIPRLAIGAYSREKIDAAILDLDPVNETAGFLQSGILGGNFLRHYRVIFYFEKGVVRFESLESNPLTRPNTSPDTSTRQ
ncbi:MAG TPA: aspartyl protease family protein [Pyrinomonadaceae bacterium]|nr:aspartyl protease family protein [Pyrinomonadaceae bacterium]